MLAEVGPCDDEGGIKLLLFIFDFDFSCLIIGFA